MSIMDAIQTKVNPIYVGTSGDITSYIINAKNPINKQVAF